MNASDEERRRMLRERVLRPLTRLREEREPRRIPEGLGAAAVVLLMQLAAPLRDPEDAVLKVLLPAIAGGLLTEYINNAGARRSRIRSSGVGFVLRVEQARHAT